MRAVIFDLDQTLLDREKSLLDFLTWQCEGMLKPYIEDQVSSDYKLGLISNGMSPFQERNFKGLGVASMFDSVIVSAAVNLRKPDPAIFHLACAELKVNPDEAVYVGDNPIADIEGARDAGLRTIFIPSTTYPHCGGV